MGEEDVVSSKAGIGLEERIDAREPAGAMGSAPVLGVFLISDGGRGQETWSPLTSASRRGFGGLEGKRPGRLLPLPQAQRGEQC